MLLVVYSLPPWWYACCLPARPIILLIEVCHTTHTVEITQETPLCYSLPYNTVYSGNELEWHYSNYSNYYYA